MKSKFNIAVLFCASVFFQAAHADQVYSYTEGFGSTLVGSFVLSGTFSEAANGVLTSLTSNVVENGTFAATLNVDTIAAGFYFTYPEVLTNGLPLELDGYFIGASGNRNSIATCGQVFLNGNGCATWQASIPAIPFQGLTDRRTSGATADGPLIATANFAQTSALQIAPVPEPSSMAMLFAGLAMIAIRRRPKH